jgi:WD40 repeat protein/serine/threonine protein kinase
MSDDPPSRPSADRNLLFGILALQMDFISRDGLIAAMHAWVLDKAKPLGLILVEQGGLEPAKRDLLERLVAAHLEMHEGDVEKSFAALGIPAPVSQELHSLGDGDVEARLALVLTPSHDATPLPATTPEKPGVLGLRYHILRLHGKGGIGEVFVALDQELNREVALKEIRTEHADDPPSRGRFVREAEITGGLEHPGIVPVYGLGQYRDGRPFYAMRFVQGETLKDAIARYHQASPAASVPGTLGVLTQLRSPEFELRALLTRFVAVCNTIAYAHSRGVIHRDIKPSNIMLGKYGETLIVDWGLAKALSDSPARRVSPGLAEPVLVPRLAEIGETQAGAALGTPAYMSPEQAAGRVDLLGPASDIYSLGATLYTLLTGRPPIQAKETADILRKAQRGEWLPPRQVKGDVPPALDAICRKAMALEPEHRYRTALELAADVERWLADEPVSAHPEPWAIRLRRWMRRHRALVSTAIGTLMVALIGAMVGLVFVTYWRNKEAAARKTAERKEQEWREQKEEADRRREEARFNQYVAQMNLVQREYEANHIARIRELLEAQVPREPGATDYRNFEWYYWRRMSHRELFTIKEHPRGVRGVIFSPDGTRLVSWDAGLENATVRVWNAASGQELLTLKGHTGGVSGVAYSRDGARLATCGRDATVRIWDAASGQELLVLKGHKGPVQGVAFRTDSRRLASWSWDGTVRLWDAAIGQELLTIKLPKGGVSGLALSPDGARLATCGQDATVRVWDTVSARELLTLIGNWDSVWGVAYSPDGTRLASWGQARGQDRTVRVWDAASGHELLALKDPAGGLFGSFDVAFSPDGTRLVAWGLGLERKHRVWDVASAQELPTFKESGGGVVGVAYSPDGQRLALARSDSTVRVYDAASGQELLILKGHSGKVWGLAFSPDGWRLASWGTDMEVRVWDLASGQDLFTLKGHPPVAWVAFSPRGRRLASAGGDTAVRIWDAASGQELATLKGHTGPVASVCFSPDGSRLASAGGAPGKPGEVKVWDGKGGQGLLSLLGHTGHVWAVCFSPDGSLLASAGGAFDNKTGEVKVWDSISGQEQLTLKAHTGPVASVCFSPDGTRLASASADQTVKVWDSMSGQELLTLKGHTTLKGKTIGGSSLAYSPDGRRLASAGYDSTVRVWDADSGLELLTFKGHTGGVFGLAYSPDGRRLASRGSGVVLVWDAASGQELLTLTVAHKSFSAVVGCLAFSPDGRRLALADSEATALIWEASDEPADVWHARAVVSEVYSLFEQLALGEEVIAVLRRNPMLNEHDRKFALQVVHNHGEDLLELTNAAWKAVKTRDAGKDSYALALRQAEAAVKVAPGIGFTYNTLGIAQYRMGRYADALATLRKSEKLNATKDGSKPADLAFLAMSEHQLGKGDEAKATLARLREVMKQPFWAGYAEAQGFLREAEELIEGKSAEKQK